MTNRDPSLDGGDSTHLFVYGTLRPGDVRWHLLSPFVAGEGRSDSAAGQVFDTGRGYPAATFGGAGAIVGRTYTLLESSIEQALDVLDEEEGAVAGLYRRISITTGLGLHAWAYEYGSGLELTPIPSGDWNRR